MPFKTKEELAAIRQELHAIAWPMVSDIENKTWKLKGGTDLEKTGLVYNGQHEKIGTVWKLEATLDITPNQYFETLMMKPELLDWVPNLVDHQILERGENNEWDVAYSRSAGIGPISGREFVSVNFYERMPDGSYSAETISIEHPNAPSITDQVVRAEYLPSACYIRPIEGDPYRCMMYWVSNIDMKGFLPREIMNLAMSTFMLDFCKAVIGKAKKMAAAASS